MIGYHYNVESHCNLQLEVLILSRCCCSVSKLSPTFCNPINCSMTGFSVLHYLREFAHSCPLSWWCRPTISSSVAPFSSCPQSFPASRSFPMHWLLPIRWPKYRNLSISPSNEHSGVISFGINWFDLLAVQGTLSRVFSSSTVQKHELFGAQPPLWSNSLNTFTWLLEKP